MKEEPNYTRENERKIPVDRYSTTAIIFSSRGAGIGIFVGIITI